MSDIQAIVLLVVCVALTLAFAQVCQWLTPRPSRASGDRSASHTKDPE